MLFGLIFDSSIDETRLAKLLSKTRLSKLVQIEVHFFVHSRKQLPPLPCFISSRLKVPSSYTLYAVSGTKWIPGYFKSMSAKRVASKCPIEELLVLIGGRWKPVILWWLLDSEEPLRFKGLRQRMPRISQKVLTQQLRELESDGLVRREMFKEMPVRVEYTPTPFGRKLRPVLRALDSWARKHVIVRKGRS
jgi:DNA-binding HxlR family transcriptional regulator